MPDDEGSQPKPVGSITETPDADPSTDAPDAAQRAARLAARLRLQAALRDAELLPETTSDERPRSGVGNRDQELLANLPPHHG